VHRGFLFFIPSGDDDGIKEAIPAGVTILRRFCFAVG
jgi:hypothetical protein